jgi:hypothetical protein
MLELAGAIDWLDQPSRHNQYRECTKLPPPKYPNEKHPTLYLGEAEEPYGEAGPLRFLWRRGARCLIREQCRMEDDYWAQEGYLLFEIVRAKSDSKVTEHNTDNVW